jgi:hypothetical protein
MDIFCKGKWYFRHSAGLSFFSWIFVERFSRIITSVVKGMFLPLGKSRDVSRKVALLD